MLFRSVASSPDEVKRVIEARATGVNVASGTSFRQASAATGTDSPAMAYADIAAIASAVRDALPPADRGRFDRHVAPDLDPFKAILLTQHSAPDRSSIRVFILIG